MPKTSFPLDTKIIVIEDDEIVRKTIIKVLQRLNFKNVLEVDNGQKALDIISQEDPPIGLILSDWRMPDIEGTELLERLRKDPKTAEVPFLMITAISQDGQLSELRKDKYTDYLTKPFRPPDLNKALVNLHQKVS